jgi:glucose/arabinose dehydrogenase
VRVLRLSRNDQPAVNQIFAGGLQQPFGIAFYHSPNPEWIYVANSNSIVRFPTRAAM